MLYNISRTTYLYTNEITNYNNNARSLINLNEELISLHTFFLTSDLKQNETKALFIHSYKYLHASVQVF